MAFADPFFESMNFVMDNGEVTFDDLGFLLGLPGGGPPPFSWGGHSNGVSSGR